MVGWKRKEVAVCAVVERWGWVGESMSNCGAE
jgi:hypothetical protein